MSGVLSCSEGVGGWSWKLPASGRDVLRRSEVVELVELTVVGPDAGLAVRPPDEPVATLDGRGLPLRGAVVHDRGHQGVGALVLVGLDRRALREPVLDAGDGGVGVLEVLLRRAVEVRLAVELRDDVPRALELLRLVVAIEVPRDHDDRLDLGRHVDEVGALDTLHGLHVGRARHVPLRQGDVELDLGHGGHLYS